jgi:Glu-tRNA(Gln) amidotransferase subunit E-like FAD-binding protein
MKIGFEIHQQLDTNKLFCSSPSELKEKDGEYEVKRRLRPTQSELGKTDDAAMKEFLKGKSFVYKGYRRSFSKVRALSTKDIMTLSVLWSWMRSRPGDRMKRLLKWL